jgi:antitoxin StbD
MFERMMELLDDNELTKIVEQRLSSSFKSIKVNIDEL